MSREFVTEDAVRRALQLQIGLAGPSSSGKTWSAMELATGIQMVTGGDIHVVDSENGRALFYADYFKFKHTSFRPPFGPDDYIAVLEHVQKRKPAITIVDSMSHEHEGPGGMLEMHEEALDRMSKGNDDRREALNWPAWAKPKAARQRLMNAIKQMDGHFILCFRAKEKSKIPSKEEKAAGDKNMRSLGWMPIGGAEYVYDMAVNFLLPPGARGVPTWKVTSPEQEVWLKVPPKQFTSFLTDPMPGPLSREHGRLMAEWAAGKGGKATREELDALVGALVGAGHDTPEKRKSYVLASTGKPVAELTSADVKAIRDDLKDQIERRSAAE